MPHNSTRNPVLSCPFPPSKKELKEIIQIPGGDDVWAMDSFRTLVFETTGSSYVCSKDDKKVLQNAGAEDCSCAGINQPSAI